VTKASLVEEATGWGIRRQAASDIVTGILDQVLSVVPTAPGDERVLAAIRMQAERIYRT